MLLQGVGRPESDEDLGLVLWRFGIVDWFKSRAFLGLSMPTLGTLGSTCKDGQALAVFISSCCRLSFDTLMYHQNNQGWYCKEVQAS